LQVFIPTRNAPSVDGDVFHKLCLFLQGGKNMNYLATR